MTSKIMWSQINTNHFARLIDHHPGGIVGDRENTLFRFNSLISDIFSHSVCDLLGNEHDFGFPATFGVWQCDFPVFDIDGSYFENFTDAHPTFGHELQHDAVAWIGRSENDLIN